MLLAWHVVRREVWRVVSQKTAVPFEDKAELVRVEGDDLVKGQIHQVLVVPACGRVGGRDSTGGS